MVWSQGTDKQTKQPWLARFAKERLNLSVSVEEALADPSVQEDLVSDEPDSRPDTTGEPISGSHSTAIIPPKLSLQSRPMPAVHLESPGPVNVAKADAGPAPSTRPVETPTRSQKKQRLAGRTTKVRLQAVPKTEKKSNGKIVVEPGKNEQSPSDGVVAVKNKTKRSGTPEVEGSVEGEVRHTTRGTLSGPGVFEQ